MSVRYFDSSLNAHQHAVPQRNTVEEMMDFRNYQAFDIGITRGNLVKRYQGMIIRDKQGVTVLTVTDPHDPEISKQTILNPAHTIDHIFNLATDVAHSMIVRQLDVFYRQIGFTMR